MVWVGLSFWSFYTYSLLSSLILSFHQAVINPFTPTPSPPIQFFISTHLWSNPINPLLVALWRTVAVGGLEKCLCVSLRTAKSVYSLRWQHHLRHPTAFFYWGCFLLYCLRNYISACKEAPMGCHYWWCAQKDFYPRWCKVQVEISQLLLQKQLWRN